MGDRCWLQIRVRKQDAEKYDEAFGWGPKFTDWLSEIQEETEHTLTGQIDEANYGCQDQLSKAAALGCVFHGSHGEGGCYGAAEFAGIDGEYFEYEIGHGGEPCVELNPRTLAIPKPEQARLKKAMNGCARAAKALDKLEKTDGKAKK